MKTPQSLSPARSRRLILLCAFGLLGMCGAALAEEYDALYLNDGSILRGTILQDISGNYLVYTPFGELSVDKEAVIYATGPEKAPPVIEETHIFIGGTTETLSIVELDVPSRRPPATSFSLLLPGVPASILAGNGDEILFRSRPAGDNSLVTVHYSEIPAAMKRIRFTLWRFDLLTPLDATSALFEQKYTPDREGTARVMVQYPKEWLVRDVTPPPTRRLNGLIVWRLTLRRQQNFTPRIVFRYGKQPETPVPSQAPMP